MLPDHLNQALLACPFGKSECLLIDGCSVVKLYEYDHRGLQSPNEWTSGFSEAAKEASRRGGLKVQARRKEGLV